MAMKDYAGQRFGRLTVVHFSHRHRTPSGQTKLKWRCRCDCGESVVVGSASLAGGNSRSCGCLAREVRGKARVTHGMSHTTEYTIWKGLNARCNDKSATSYHRYGARGIKVCKRWAGSFEAFIGDMGRRPTPRHSIERVDNDGDYSPENCEWALPAEQARNRRSSVLVRIGNETKCATDWALENGVNPKNAQRRIRRGWCPVRAVTESDARG